MISFLNTYFLSSLKNKNDFFVQIVNISAKTKIHLKHHKFNVRNQI